jgi:hypothetical protein
MLFNVSFEILLEYKLYINIKQSEFNRLSLGVLKPNSYN